jgi:hypothetical protein
MQRQRNTEAETIDSMLPIAASKWACFCGSEDLNMQVHHSQTGETKTRSPKFYDGDGGPGMGSS